MSGEENQGEEQTIVENGDLVICLDTGSVGVVLELVSYNIYLVSFPHGAFQYEREDFDVLKSGR